MNRRTVTPGPRSAAARSTRGRLLTLWALLASSALFLIASDRNEAESSAVEPVHATAVAVRTEDAPLSSTTREREDAPRLERHAATAPAAEAAAAVAESSCTSAAPAGATPTRIRVVDASGAPVAGAAIEIWRERADAPGAPEEYLNVHSDAQGACVVDGEWIRLGAVAWTSTATTQPICHSSFAAEIELTLHEARALRGIVRDASNGQPIEDAEICVWTHARSDSVRSNSDGTFAHPRLPSSGPRQQVRASASGYASRIALVECDALDGTRTWSSASAREHVHGRDTDAWLEFELLPEAVIHGRVHDSRGTPIAGARVCAEGYVSMAVDSATPDRAEACTDADGRYELRGLRPDIAHALQVTAPQFASQLVELGSAANHEIDVQLELGARLEGLVLDPSGAPAEGLHIALRRTDPPAVAVGGPESVCARKLGRSSTTTTDAAGAFALEGLGAHRYELRVMRGRSVVLSQDLAPESGEQIALPPLLLDARWLTLHGTVAHDEPTADVAGTRVEVRRERVLGSVHVGVDGSFHVAGLDDKGPYELRWYASESGGRPLATSKAWAFEPVRLRTSRRQQ